MSSQSESSAGGMLMTLAVLTLIILVAVWYVNLPGHQSFGQRIGDAIDATPRVIAHAADQLTGHPTAADMPAKVNETKTKVNEATAKVDATLKKTGDAASTAAAELGNDIKAAVDEQKKQNATHKPDHAATSPAPQTE